MIPYNPSSFNTNKTILEQILELKNWLKDHPSYRIFISSQDFDPIQFTYTLSDVSDNTDMNVGDVVLYANGFVSDVATIDRDNDEFTRNISANVNGPRGPRGYPGADGTNGTNGTNGEDGAYVSAATVDGNGDLQITIYDPATSTTSTINAGHVVGPEGSGIQIVALTSTSGTLSADDLSKVTGTDDCIITYTNAGATLVFKRASIDSSYAYFTNVVVDGDTYYLSCEVDVTTGAYNLGMDQLPIKASNVNSETATNGQVLTADGNGGASWQNAGGGSTLYMHCIRAFLSDANYKLSMNTTIIRQSNIPIDTWAQLRSALNSMGITSISSGNALQTSGAIIDVQNSNNFITLSGITRNNSGITFSGLDANGNDTILSTSFSTPTVYDKIITL